MTTRHRPNQPRFVDETVDGEALIMDMLRGTYYSCAGPSAEVWNALKAGASVDEVAALLAGAYHVPVADASVDVGRFLDQLLADELLVVAEDATQPSVPPFGSGSPYLALEVERYTDLADLILLDPVHDVSEAGWPHTSS